MAISVSCDCGKTYRVGDDKAGKKIKCKDCGAVLAVPADDDDFVEADEDEEYERPVTRRPAARGGARSGGRSSRPAPKRASSSSGGMPAAAVIAIVIVLLLMVGGTAGYFLMNRKGGSSITELTYIPNDAGVYVLVRPSRLLKSPLLSGLPQDTLDDSLKKLEEQGLSQLDPRKIEFIAIAGTPPQPPARPMAGGMPPGMPGGMPMAGAAPGAIQPAAPAGVPMPVPTPVPMPVPMPVPGVAGAPGVAPPAVPMPGGALPGGALPGGAPPAAPVDMPIAGQTPSAPMPPAIAPAQMPTAMPPTMAGGPAAAPGKEGAAIVLRTTEPVDFATLIQNAKQSASNERTEQTYKGRKYWKFGPKSASGSPGGMPAVPAPPPTPGAPSSDSKALVIVPMDDRTLLMGNESIVLAMLDAKPKSGTLSAKVKSQSLDRDLLVVMLPGTMQTMSQVGSMLAPPMLRGGSPGADTFNQMKTLVAAVDLTGPDMLTVSLDAKDADAATRMENSIKEGQKKLEDFYSMVTGELRNPETPQAQRDILTFVDKLKSGISVSRTGSETTLTLKNPGGWESLVAALRPVIEESRQAAKSAMVRNNMRQIALAMHNFHDVNSSLPPAADGKGAGLSWRVHLLRFLGENALYEKFKLDEAWDSPTNRPLVDQMPKVFESATPGEKGKTRFVSFAGEGALFGQSKGPSFADVRDGTSNTLLFVEAGLDKGVIWTKPEDLPFNPSDPRPALGQFAGQKFLAAFVDGSVRTLNLSLDKDTLKAIITIAGGEMVDPLKLID